MDDFDVNSPSHWRDMADEVRRTAELSADGEARNQLLAKAALYERMAHLAETAHPMFGQRDFI